MDDLISNLDYRPKLLLHACCAICSTYVIKYLKEYFDITVLFYNPNIEPVDEYHKRKNELIKLINIYQIDYIDIDYLNEDFKKIAKGLENEKEGGGRCYQCYYLRLDKTAQIAKEKGFDYFTTTLTISPYKNAETINNIGKLLMDKYSVKYLFSDFKKKEGYKKANQLSSDYKLYRQNYCGCLYSKRGNHEDSN